MRGTLSLADSMLDLLADTVPYAGGVAHKGVARYYHSFIARNIKCLCMNCRRVLLQY
jgi:hypothetical protein